MSLIPPGYSPLPLAPKIQIIDETDTVRYTFESNQIADDPIQDFDLERWDLARAVNTEHGSLVLVIDDTQKNLIKSDSVRRESQLKPTWQVKFFLGKDKDNLHEWFRGYLLSNTIEFPDPVQTKHQLFFAGESSKYKYYMTRFKSFQKKIADGVTLDTTDNEAKISEIFKKLVLDTNHHATPTEPLGFTANGVQDIDIKLPDYQKNFASIGQCLSELASIASAYFGVDMGDVYLRRRGSVDSGFLITNMDWDDMSKMNWDQDKIAYLSHNNRTWTDEFFQYGIRFFHGLNTQKLQLDYTQADGNATLDLSTTNYAFPITAVKDNIMKVAPFLSKSGTLTEDLTARLVGANANGDPNFADTKIVTTIKGDELDKQLTTAKYFEIAFNKTFVIAGSKVFFVLDRYHDTTNSVQIDYQTTQGSYHAGGLVNWSELTGNVKLRVYSGKTTHVLCENTSVKSNFPNMQRQMNIPLSNFQSTDTSVVMLSGIALSRGQARRRYPPFTISAPTEPLKLGQTFRFVDIRTGIKLNPDLISYHLSGDAYDPQSNGGAITVEITMEDWY